MNNLHPIEQAAIKRGVALPTISGKQAESDRLAAELAEWLASGGSVTYDAPLPYVPRPVCTYYAPDIIIRPRFAPKVSPQVAQMRQNCEAIIESLRAAGVMSLNDLADSVGRTVATAGRHVRMLIDDGVVKPCGSVEGDQTYTKRMYMLV